MNFKEFLFYEKHIYILKEKSVKAELLKNYYNNILAEYFEVERTFELIDHKYYWNDINKDIKNYIFLYNICQRIKVSKYCLYSKMQILLHSEES